MADAPDEDEMEELQMELEQHYDVGTTIRDEVIPNAVKWFTGEALEDMEDDDDDDDEEGEEGGAADSRLRRATRDDWAGSAVMTEMQDT